MKTTKYNSLVNLLAEKQTVSGIRKNDVRTSLNDILKTGITHTGYSCKGQKKIWTAEVSEILTRLNIQHETGNDAPRGGACGEYVKVTSPAFMAIVTPMVKAENAKRDAEYAAFVAGQNAIKERIRIASEKITDEIKAEYSKEVESRCDGSLHGQQRRNNRKKARKVASRLVGQKYGIEPDMIDYFSTTSPAIINSYLK